MSEAYHLRCSEDTNRPLRGQHLSSVRTDDLGAYPHCGTDRPQYRQTRSCKAIEDLSLRLRESGRRRQSQRCAYVCNIARRVTGRCSGGYRESPVWFGDECNRQHRRRDPGRWYSMSRVAGGVESMSRAPFVIAKQTSAFGRNTQMYRYDTGLALRQPQARRAVWRRFDGRNGRERRRRFRNVSRDDQDAFALRSQQRAEAAIESKVGLADEIVARITVPQRKGDPVIVDYR